MQSLPTRRQLHSKNCSHFLPVPTYGNRFPDCVFITHNHLDHAGEFPLLLALDGKRRFHAKECMLRVLSGPEVEERLKLHRLHEMLTQYKPVRPVC